MTLRERILEALHGQDATGHELAERLRVAPSDAYLAIADLLLDGRVLYAGERLRPCKKPLPLFTLAEYLPPC